MRQTVADGSGAAVRDVEHRQSGGILQDISTVVPQPPRRIAVIVVGRRRTRGGVLGRFRLCGRRLNRGDREPEARGEHHRRRQRRRRSWWRGAPHSDRRGRPAARPDLDGLARRRQESTQVSAKEIGTRRQRAELEPAAAIADREGRRGAKSSHDGAFDGSAVLLLDDTLDGSGGRRGNAPGRYAVTVAGRWGCAFGASLRRGEHKHQTADRRRRRHQSGDACHVGCPACLAGSCKPQAGCVIGRMSNIPARQAPARRPALPVFETILGSRNGEVDVPGDRLVGDLVGHLDLEPVITFRERPQRHALAGLKLMARRDIELRRKRLRIQRLRRRLVEEFLAGFAGLARFRLAAGRDLTEVVTPPGRPACSCCPSWGCRRS